MATTVRINFREDGYTGNMSPGVIQGGQALGQGGRGNTERWDIPGVASEAL